jgi:hypothetical protein
VNIYKVGLVRNYDATATAEARSAISWFGTSDGKLNEHGLMSVYLVESGLTAYYDPALVVIAEIRQS